MQHWHMAPAKTPPFNNLDNDDDKTTDGEAPSFVEVFFEWGLRQLRLLGDGSSDEDGLLTVELAVLGNVERDVLAPG